MGHRIAIVGAGVAGLAAALRLTEAGEEVVVYEKSRGLSGRAATRTKEGCRYDFGANYFKVGCNEVAKLVFETLPTEGLTRIVGDILAFDRDGKISPADPERNAGARWNYRDGISTLGKRLAAKGGFTIVNEVCVTGLKRAGGCWQLEDGSGKPLGDFDRVLLTPPAPQAADLLEASDVPSSARPGVIAGLRKRRILASVFGGVELSGSDLPAGKRLRPHQRGSRSRPRLGRSGEPEGGPGPGGAIALRRAAFARAGRSGTTRRRRLRSSSFATARLRSLLE
jgi:predicted NAD/FAD-dependent oxidoreductase